MAADSLKDAFERALEAILARVFACDTKPRIAVAYSGGLDSSVLLRLACEVATERDLELRAFHVHHGLSANADAWAGHCEAECRRIGAIYEVRRVAVRAVGEGVEQAARKARYAALGALCAEHRIDLLLTAHHQDDQAETVLLQLLRGAGVAGMAGMEALNKAPGLLGQESTWIARPLLAVGRAELHAWAAAIELVWVEDESNADPRHMRNRLRHGVMPLLEQGFSGYQGRIVRAAGHLRDAQHLLDELARDDLARCADGEGLALSALSELGRARTDNVLRHWFAQKGVRMPSSAWLEQMRTQVFAAADDARVRIVHPDCELWRYRGRLLLVERVDDEQLDVSPAVFGWRGEDSLAFPSFRGSLHFDVTELGLEPAWLREQKLTLRYRSGGERLRLGPQRPSRNLKHHFQALGVPPWGRQRLPLLYAGEELVYAAGIGLNFVAGVPFIAGGIAPVWRAAERGAHLAIRACSG